MKTPVVVIISLLIGAFIGKPQKDPIFFKIKNDFGVVNYDLNKLLHPETLDPFFKKLSELQTTKTGKISILHIGDSHVQADWGTGKIRENFQTEFGNAGRGLIFPAKAARSNESYSFESAATGVWETKRAVFPEQPLPIGIGGITLKTSDTTATITVKIKEREEVDPSHNKITFFYEKTPNSFFAEVKDSLTNTIAYLGDYTREKYSFASTIYLKNSYNFFSLAFRKTQTIQTQFILYGMNLENQKSGIVYHSIGVNGAKAKHYVEAQYFLIQTAALDPDLIIISLGTNEAMENPALDPNYERQVNDLLDGLQKFNPETPILITTPPGNFKNRNKKNPATEEVVSQLLKIGLNRNISLFNLYESGGGKNFSSQWMKNGLMQKDGVHFTKTGYELQGDMLYLALINAYNHFNEL